MAEQNDPRAPVTLGVTVTPSSGRMFSMMLTAPRETWNEAGYGGARLPLAVRDRAWAQLMQPIIEQARSLGIYERLAWPQVLVYEPQPVGASEGRQA